MDKGKLDPNMFLETSSGTKISKKSSIFGLQDITVQSNVKKKIIKLKKKKKKNVKKKSKN